MLRVEIRGCNPRPGDTTGCELVLGRGRNSGDSRQATPDRTICWTGSSNQPSRGKLKLTSMVTPARGRPSSDAATTVPTYG